MSKQEKKVIQTAGLTKTLEEHAQEKFPEKKETPKVWMPSQDLIGGLNQQSAKNTPSIKQDTAYMEQQERDIAEYNDNIEQLDPLYTSLTPVRGAIVRMQRLNMVRKEGGIIDFPQNEIVLKTKNLMVKERVTAEYQFARVGVIVAVAPQYKGSFQPGDVIQVEPEAVMPLRPTEEHLEVLPFWFTHYSCTDARPTTNVKDKHHGYFILREPMGQIDCIIKRAQRNEEDTKVSK